jgi:hypothetical protein
MPTFPWLPLKSRNGGFSPVRFQGRYIRRAFLSITSSSHRAVCLRPSCISLPGSSYPRAESRDEVRGCTTVQTATAALPQGPSLRSGLCCPGPSSLKTGPMRPTPRHSSISPLGGLYALSSLCVIARRLAVWRSCYQTPDPRTAVPGLGHLQLQLPAFSWVHRCRPLVAFIPHVQEIGVACGRNVTAAFVNGAI